MWVVNRRRKGVHSIVQVRARKACVWLLVCGLKIRTAKLEGYRMVN